MKNKKIYILLVSLIAVAAMLWNVISAPGIRELKGNFRETAFIRNEQNSGPVIRIYAVKLEGEYWKEMEQYGNYMPHTKYGTTRIYFFLHDKPYPEKLTLGSDNMEQDLKKNCLAIYEKDGMSQVSFTRYPFKNTNHIKISSPYDK